MEQELEVRSALRGFLYTFTYCMLYMAGLLYALIYLNNYTSGGVDMAGVDDVIIFWCILGSIWFNAYWKIFGVQPF